MTGFEYKVVPAPMRGLKAKGVKGSPARFANALETVMNDLGADGWEYQRTDTLPVEERQGLTGKTTSFQNMLVFRRVLETPQEDAPVVAALIEDQSEVEVEPEVAAPALQPIEDTLEDTPQDAPDAPEDFVGKQADDFVEEAAQTLDAQDRVEQTLKAPFSFPWNKRRVAATPKDDAKDSNIPAE